MVLWFWGRPSARTLLNQIKGEQTRMANELAVLTQEVADTIGAEASIIKALDGIYAALQDAIANNNQQALVDLTNQLGAQRANIAAAILRDPVPAAPAPPADAPSN